MTARSLEDTANRCDAPECRGYAVVRLFCGHLLCDAHTFAKCQACVATNALTTPNVGGGIA